MKRMVLSLLGVLIHIVMPLSPAIPVAVADGEYDNTASNTTPEYHAGNETDAGAPPDTVGLSLRGPRSRRGALTSSGTQETDEQSSTPRGRRGGHVQWPVFAG